MRVAHLRSVAFVSLTVMLGAVPRAAAQSLPASVPAPTQVQQVRDELERLKKEFEALRQQYDLRIASLEQRVGGLAGPNAMLTPAPAPTSDEAVPALRALTTAPAAEPPQEPAPPQQQSPPPPPTPPQEPPPPPQEPTAPPAQSVAGASKVFNPDIAVIANFVGVAGKNAMSEQPPLSLREAEVSFQAVVDPYARADFFLAAGPEGVEVEEGFITFNTLPAHLLVKVGKMRASFGKVNTTHAHVMPTADRPIVTENLVGGEEGISDSGVSLSKLIMNPLLFLEATGEVFAGRSEVFQTNERSRLNYVGRLRAYRDLTEGTNLDVGASVAYGPTNLTAMLGETFAPEELDLNKRLIGVDATLRYRPLRRAIYKRFMARTELVWSRQDMPSSLHQSAFGLYVFGEYQFARRWYLGARYDQSERALDSSLQDRGGSLFLTFWPSEFSQIRTQYRRTNYAEGISANEVLFQFRFGIGAHAAHTF